MVQLDSGLGFTAAPSVVHRQRALQAPNQIVSAFGRTQEDADRPLAEGTAARVSSKSAVPLCLRRFMCRAYLPLPTPVVDVGFTTPHSGAELPRGAARRGRC